MATRYLLERTASSFVDFSSPRTVLLSDTFNQSLTFPVQQDLSCSARVLNTGLCADVFFQSLTFLEPQDLSCSAKVCKAWNKKVESELQWKLQCHNLFDLPLEIDPKVYVPGNLSYKEIFQLVHSNIFGKNVYERYIGKIGSVPGIPKGLSLRRWNQPDPCDSNQEIGRAYVWMYIPSHIEIDSEGVALSKIDDPNDAEAPLLLRKEAGLVKSVSRAIEFGARSENSVLRVPITINNIEVLFKHPKAGNPSIYRYISDYIVEEHGNKRWSAGWVCMRKDVIGRNLFFHEQQALAQQNGVVLSELLPRILFNCLGHLRSGEARIYPDGREEPSTLARTSTIAHDTRGNALVLGCGEGASDGLMVDIGQIVGMRGTGLAVVLPAEARAISP